MLMVGFPDLSVRCCTSKYCVQKYWEKSVEHTHAEPVAVGQGEGKYCQYPQHAKQPLPCPVMEVSTPSSPGDMDPPLRHMDFSLFIKMLIYSCLGAFHIRAH